jgi:hypothetical protein
MSERRFPSQPDDMLRRLGSQVVPVEEPARVQQRREQVVASLSRTIRENAEHKRRALRTRVLWGVGLAASLAIAVGVAARAQQRAFTSTLATVADVRGAVVVTEGGESRVLSHGSKLELHAVGEIETALEAQAEIRSQKSLLRIGSATKLTVPQATPIEERYRLALGRVDVSVDKDSRLTRSVVVETPNAEVVVHGTVFAVGVAARSGHKVTEVSVTRGSVWVLANGVQVAVLGPGQHWSSEVQGASSLNLPAVPVVPAPPVAAPDTTRDSATHLVHREATPAEAKASTLAEQSRLFQEAIDARNRGDDARAAESFTRLLSRYPSYEEAEVQLFRAQKRLGRTALAAAEARRYLALHPQGFAHEEARVLALGSGLTQQR